MASSTQVALPPAFDIDAFIASRATDCLIAARDQNTQGSGNEYDEEESDCQSEPKLEGSLAEKGSNCSEIKENGRLLPPPLPPRPQTKLIVALTEEDEHIPDPGSMERQYNDWISDPQNQAAVGTVDAPGSEGLRIPYSSFFQHPRQFPAAAPIFDLDVRGEWFRNPFLQATSSRHISSNEKEDEYLLESDDFEDLIKILPDYTKSTPSLQISNFQDSGCNSLGNFEQDEDFIVGSDSKGPMSLRYSASEGSLEEGLAPDTDNCFQESGMHASPVAKHSFGEDIRDLDFDHAIYYWGLDVIPNVQDAATRASISDYSSESVPALQSSPTLFDGEPPLFSPIDLGLPFHSPELVCIQDLEGYIDEQIFTNATVAFFDNMDVEGLAD